MTTCARCQSRDNPTTHQRTHWTPPLDLCDPCDAALVTARHDQLLLLGRSLDHDPTETAPPLITQRREERHRTARVAHEHIARPSDAKVSELRYRRLAAGLRIRDVAEETGLAPTRISQLERNEGTPARPDELKVLTDLLDLSEAPVHRPITQQRCSCHSPICPTCCPPTDGRPL